MSSSDIIVVGAGVIGCSIAYHAAQLGAHVTVIERNSEVGAHASSVAAGILAITPHDARETPLEMLAYQSLQLYPDLAAELLLETGIDCQLCDTGMVELALSESDAMELSAFAQTHVSDTRYNWMSSHELHKAEPAITYLAQGALARSGPSHVHSGLLTQALAQAATIKGVRFRTNVTVAELLTEGKRVTGIRAAHEDCMAGHVVLAAGPWTPVLASSIGTQLPISPVKGQVVSMQWEPGSLTRVVYAEGRYVVPRPDGTVIIGATRTNVGFDDRPTSGAVHELLSAALGTIPSLNLAQFGSTKVGFRPHTPDKQPILGQVAGWDGLIVAAGHGGNGILLAPVTGLLISELLNGGPLSQDLAPFSHTRFNDS